MRKFLTQSSHAVVFAGALSAALLLTSGASAQGRAAAVLVDTVEMREIRDTQAVIGRLVATRQSDVACRVAGVIKTVAFQVGDRVAKGFSLITLDATRLKIEKRASEAAIVAAQAAAKVAEAKLKLAEQAFERQAGLKNSTAFSRSRFDDLKQSAVQSRSELGEAEAKLELAKVGLARVNYELEHATVAAPFAGIVVARQAQPGQYVQAGGTIATLLDIDDLEIAADIPGQIANGLKPGTTLDAVFDNGDVRKVTVRTAMPVENRSTRTRPVRLKIKLAGMQTSHIAVGSAVTLKVPVSSSRQVATVPKDALLRGRRGWSVFVVKNNKAEPRPVVLGQAVSDRMEVRSGVEPGDIVVVRGNERLRPGQGVRPKHVAATRPKQG